MQLLSDFDTGSIKKCIDAGEPFWLDLRSSPAQLPEGLEHALGIDQEAHLPRGHGGSGPELTAHDGHMSAALVAVAAGDGRETEVPITVLLAREFIVTVHEADLDLGQTPVNPPRSPAAAFARVLSSVTGSYPPVIAAVDDEIETVQELALAGDRTVLARVQRLRGRVLHLRRALVAQRDAVGRAMDEMLEGEPPSAEIRAVRNAYERFVRLADMLDSSRELIFAATDLYLSAASNRLGLLAERLTLFATVFLPATVVVGFFGQNFLWLTDNVQSFAAFVLLGVGGLTAAVVVPIALLRRRGFLSDPD